jgi:hypothetical protein
MILAAILALYPPMAQADAAQPAATPSVLVYHRFTHAATDED